MSAFIGELVGTFLLVLLGNGVVAACILNKTKAQNSGWIAIVLGWGMAVMIAVYASGFLSGAHLNPAVTIAMAALGNLSWGLVPSYIAAQFLGAMLASLALLPALLSSLVRNQGCRNHLGLFLNRPSHSPYGLQCLWGGPGNSSPRHRGYVYRTQ